MWTDINIRIVRSMWLPAITITARRLPIITAQGGIGAITGIITIGIDLI
ncbi:MAG: hypothetical protein IPL59_21375 [Candidatus Competibacteraceae bacterium]|nr:hypothetical protein [Candidatus Competibacteraceae bacterium]